MSGLQDHPISKERRQSRGVLKRQTIVEDNSTSPTPLKRQHTLTVHTTSPSSNDEAHLGLSRPLSGLSTPAKSPTRLSPHSNINISKSDDRLGPNTRKVAARWRAASSFERSDSRATTSVRVSGRRPRASAFRLGANSVSGSSKAESFSLSRDSGGKSPHLSPHQRVKREKSLSANSTSSSDRNKSPKISFQTSSDVSAESPHIKAKEQGAEETNPTADVKNEMEPQKKFSNYQIKAIKKGLPDIVGRDPQGRKYSIIQRDITITPYFVCQKNNKESQKKPIAWAFSIFTVFICVVFPLMSFSADVAFYVTCSDHYNDTAELLVNVTAGMSKTLPTINFKDEGKHYNEADHQLAASPIITYILSTVQSNPTLFPPAPLMSRDYLPSYDAVNGEVVPMKETNKSSPSSNSIFTVEKTNDPRTGDNSPSSVLISSVNISVCADPTSVIEFMKTDQAAQNLEHHRHVTIDIFEPVFILGSFPSLLLCILTRFVVMVTGHDHFISAYFINLACLPLQLATGALGVYSAAYHWGEKGFSCWRCSVQGDCSHLDSYSWLREEVSTALLASLITKLLDGIAGGIVVFVVIMRVLWRKTSHVTVWWYVLRCFASVMICSASMLIGSLLVLTPALMVIKFNMLPLAENFPGHDVASSAIFVLFIIGTSSWCLSCGILFVYLIYNCYIYCRIKEH